MQPQSAAELRSALSSFTGSTEFYTHVSGMLYTEGVRFLAESARAYWLLDLIAAHQPQARRDPMLREFQLWELRVEGSSAVAICFRDTNDEAFRQTIACTDFPLPAITLYVEGGTILLPSEH